MSFRGTISLSVLALLASQSAAQAPVSEGVGFGSPITSRIVAEDCRMAIIGDSISVKNQDDSTRSTMFWGITRTWRPYRWVGVCTASNDKFPNIQTRYINNALANAVVKNLQTDPPGNRDFSYGYTRIAPSAAVDVTFNLGINAPDLERVVGSRLLENGNWLRGDWFEDVAIQSRLIYVRTPQTLKSARLRTRRDFGTFADGPVMDLSGQVAIVGIDGPLIFPQEGAAELRVTTAGDHDESDANDHFIWLTTRFFRPGVEGFHLDSLAVGGARVADWLNSGPYIDNTLLDDYLVVSGNPNVFYVQIGANDRGFDQDWLDDYTSMLNRFEALSFANGITPYYVLVAPYGTLAAISDNDAQLAADLIYTVARDGTSMIEQSRIGFINMPKLLGGPIDQTLLIDTIHPTRAGADLITTLAWRELIKNQNCRADLTGTADPGAEGFGVPDGDADANDFFYFLDLFVAQDLIFGDFTGSSDPNDPSFEVPDGDIDSDDFFYFLDQFVGPC